MSLFLLGWLIASVPVGVVLGWLCGVNNLSRDEGELPLSDTAVGTNSVRRVPKSVAVRAAIRVRRCPVPHQSAPAGRG
jgi:hypothetical protein